LGRQAGLDQSGFGAGDQTAQLQLHDLWAFLPQK
jgi:hypothetical protein